MSEIKYIPSCDCWEIHKEASEVYGRPIYFDKPFLDKQTVAARLVTLWDDRLYICCHYCGKPAEVIKEEK